MSVAQFDALLVILQPHIKKNTTNSHEFSVKGSIQCFVLRDEVDQLVRRHSGFWCLLVQWLWIVKTPLKMPATDDKNAENRTRSEFFYDKQKFQRQCVNVIDTMWGRIYFFTCENFRQTFRSQCARTLRGKLPTYEAITTAGSSV